MPGKTGIYVVNMVGTSHRKCSCPSGNGSWIKHWELATKQARGKCIVKYCGSKAQVGAHVKDCAAKITPWIAPFCQYHNKRPTGTQLQLKPHSWLAACASHDCDQ